jgi:glycogen debranching enzyme
VHLTALVNERFWDEGTGFYHDLDRTGKRRTTVKSIGAYWALLAGAVPANRLETFVAHLSDPKAFLRHHRVPSLSADSEGFDAGGGYWKGGVWPPTNYMVLRGLDAAGQLELARDIAVNHLDNVARGVVETGTLWENYAPDVGTKGQGHSTPDFVGWTGLVPTAVLLEFVLGLRPDAPHAKLVWNLDTLDAVEVDRYPFGASGQIDLKCQARTSVQQEPQVTFRSNVDLVVELRWNSGQRVLQIKGNKR